MTRIHLSTLRVGMLSMILCLCSLWYHAYVLYDIVPIIVDVWHLIVCKRSSWKKGICFLIFVEIFENQTLNFWKILIVPTIELILKINTKCVYFA
jgi:hypothetical protein